MEERIYAVDPVVVFVESPFAVLGIEPDASDAEVIEAYRRRVKEAHPDHGGSEYEFQRVQSAYAQLQSGKECRSRYAGRPGTDGDDGAEDGTAPGGDRRTDGRRVGDIGEPARSAQHRRSQVEYLDFESMTDLGLDLGDDDLFEQADAADLDPSDHGKILVRPDETLLEAAENRGFAWPFACRGGACTNCAVAVKDGEMPTPPGHILPPELIEKGIRLACISAPTTSDAKVVYNVKHLPGVDELRLPPSRFKRTYADD